MNGHEPKEEVTRRSREIYERDIREKLEPDLQGQFLVLDMESGDYEVAEKDLLASKRLLSRKPQGVLYGLRIGYPTAYKLRALRRTLISTPAATPDAG